jgi:hypothetical protein
MNLWVPEKTEFVDQPRDGWIFRDSAPWNTSSKFKGKNA